MVTHALPDANVLYSRTLRDWLLLLRTMSNGEMFHLHYTVDILSETIYSIRRERPDLTGTQVTLINDQIAAAMDTRIDDYAAGTNSPLADIFDRHVHAAAVAGRMDCIITLDKGFTDLPENSRDNLGYEIYTPDEFLILADESAARYVQAVILRQLKHFRSRGIDPQLSERLAASGCPDFADRVREHCRQLAQ